jgi:hypothetical protein
MRGQKASGQFPPEGWPEWDLSYGYKLEALYRAPPILPQEALRLPTRSGNNVHTPIRRGP